MRLRDLFMSAALAAVAWTPSHSQSNPQSTPRVGIIVGVNRATANALLLQEDSRMTSSSRSLIRILITSSGAGAPALQVRGALYGSGSSTIEIIDGLTPVEVPIQGPVVSGMVQAVDVSSRIRVDVLEQQDDESRPLMGACARTVLLGEQLRAGRFIRGAA